MINEFTFFPQLCLMDFYRSRVLSTFLEIVREILHQLILRVTIPNWSCQGLIILKYFDIFDWWIPFLLHHFWNSLLYMVCSEKVLFSHWDCNIGMYCTPSPGHLSNIIRLCAFMYSFKRFHVALLEYSGNYYLLMYG